MSVVDLDKVDAIGQQDDDKSIVGMMLTDHLDWEQEYEHLMLLQEKINNYLGFIQSGQAQKMYPDTEIRQYRILLFFLYPITENCRKFIEAVNRQIQEINTQLILKTNGDTESIENE